MLIKQSLHSQFWLSTTYGCSTYTSDFFSVKKVYVIILIVSWKVCTENAAFFLLNNS
jgi:hypothetical protein